jgi:hypothetical protein
VNEFGNLKSSLSFPAVGQSRLLYSVLTWISKLCLDSLLRLLRARTSLLQQYVSFFSIGDALMRVLFGVVICFGLLLPHLVLYD